MPKDQNHRLIGLTYKDNSLGTTRVVESMPNLAPGYVTVENRDGRDTETLTFVLGALGLTDPDIQAVEELLRRLTMLQAVATRTVQTAMSHECGEEAREAIMQASRDAAALSASLQTAKSLIEADEVPAPKP